MRFHARCLGWHWMRLPQGQKQHHHIGMARDPSERAALPRSAPRSAALRWVSCFWCGHASLRMVSHGARRSRKGRKSGWKSPFPGWISRGSSPHCCQCSINGGLQTTFAVGCRGMYFFFLLAFIFIRQTPNLQ